jgi:hypothetical protein
MITIKTETPISPERIACLMISAVEGGCNYWCSGLFLERPTEKGLSEQPWYAAPELYENPELRLRVVEQVEVDDETKDYVVDLIDIQRGLQIMAEKYPTHFADIVNENDDAITADVFLQCVALKEVVYG